LALFEAFEVKMTSVNWKAHLRTFIDSGQSHWRAIERIINAGQNVNLPCPLWLNVLAIQLTAN